MPVHDPLAPLRVADHQQLVALSGGDPYVRYGVERPLRGLAFHLDGAVVTERVHHRLPARHSLVGTGPADALDVLLGRLVAAHVPAQLGVASVSVPQDRSTVAERHFTFAPGGGHWDWMWTTTPPPWRAPEGQVLLLDDHTDAPAIESLSTRHSPSAEGEPGTGTTERWVGVRVGERLVAAGALQRLGSGTAHLAGIVVHPDHRGRGWGAAVTAALTRWAVCRDGVCTLGMYSENTVARSVYRGLGYRTAHAWVSRPLR